MSKTTKIKEKKNEIGLTKYVIYAVDFFCLFVFIFRLHESCNLNVKKQKSKVHCVDAIQNKTKGKYYSTVCNGKLIVVFV